LKKWNISKISSGQFGTNSLPVSNADWTAVGMVGIDENMDSWCKP
jgi:hypothetical protein